MDDAIDGGSGGHGILEDPIPFAEDEIAGDQEGPTLIPLGHHGEEDLGLVGALLDVADVVEDEQVEDVEPAEGAGQREVAFGRQQVLDDLVGGREENRVSAVDECMPDGDSGVALAD